MIASWSARRITRRHLLRSVSALAAIGTICPLLPQRAALADSIDSAAFLDLSRILTGRSALDPAIAARALAALTAGDSSFPTQVARLREAIETEGLSDMRHFNSFTLRHPALAPTALTIISAWYLGYTGTPAMNSTQDDAHFVTYAGALMYQPTADATVIPSFSRGRTNYWAEPPATIAKD